MWCLKKQPIVTLSSIEAECQIIFKDEKKTTWLIMFMNKLHVFQTIMPLYINNQIYMKIVKNPIYHTHTKHIKVHYYYIIKKIFIEKWN